jgi:hypothetical protein
MMNMAGKGQHISLVFLFLATTAMLTWAPQVEAVTISFVSGDYQPCVAGAGECVSVNTKTTIQTGHPAITNVAGGTAVPASETVAGGTGSGIAHNVFVLDGNCAITAFCRQNQTDWYHPENPNPNNPTAQSLNGLTGLTAYWVSYTDSGVDANPNGSTANGESPFPDHNPNPPAVPNYCGTPGPYSATVGPNLNPTGNPGCTSLDPKGNKAIAAPDNNRVIGNQTAKFTQTVEVAPTTGSYNLEFYVWADDATIVELFGPGGTVTSLAANSGQGVHCSGGEISCQLGTGGRFTASGLSGGTYTLNLYAFQTNSDVFGVLWGGVFTELAGPVIPEPSSILLLGSGLAGLGLLRKRRKHSY